MKRDEARRYCAGFLAQWQQFLQVPTLGWPNVADHFARALLMCPVSVVGCHYLAVIQAKAGIQDA